MADRNDFPDEYVERDREALGAARGLSFVMLTALAFVLACVAYRQVIA